MCYRNQWRVASGMSIIQLIWETTGVHVSVLPSLVPLLLESLRQPEWYFGSWLELVRLRHRQSIDSLQVASIVTRRAVCGVSRVTVLVEDSGWARTARGTVAFGYGSRGGKFKYQFADRAVGAIRRSSSCARHPWDAACKAAERTRALTRPRGSHPLAVSRGRSSLLPYYYFIHYYPKVSYSNQSLFSRS